MGGGASTGGSRSRINNAASTVATAAVTGAQLAVVGGAVLYERVKSELPGLSDTVMETGQVFVLYHAGMSRLLCLIVLCSGGVGLCKAEFDACTFQRYHIWRAKEHGGGLTYFPWFDSREAVSQSSEPTIYGGDRDGHDSPVANTLLGYPHGSSTCAFPTYFSGGIGPCGCAI